jgi:hypothetical protein
LYANRGGGAKLLDQLAVTGDILLGSLLQTTIRNHAKNCAKTRERRRRLTPPASTPCLAHNLDLPA